MSNNEWLAGGLSAITINRDSAVPPSVQIEEDLRTQILAGTFSEGRRLPPETELARQYGVSRVTIRSALARLADSRLLQRVHGVGTIVTPPPPPIVCDVGLMMSFVEQLRRAGHEAEAILDRCEIATPSAQIAEALGIPPDGQAVVIRRIIKAEQRPIAVNTSWVPAHIAPGLERIGLTNGSLWGTLRKHFGLKPVRAENTIDFIEGPSPESRLLQVAGHDLLVRMTGLMRDSQNRALEMSISVWASGNTKFRFSSLVAE
jgi:GntR family transcriptional regulator